MVDFGNTTVSNDITPEVGIQQAVVDRSGEIMGNGIAKAFDSIGSVVSSAFENKKAAAGTKILDDYRLSMVNIANSVDQGSITLQEAATRRRNLYTTTLSNNPGIGGDLDKVDGKVVGETGIANLAREGTVQQQAMIALQKKAIEAGWSDTESYQEHLAAQNRLSQITTGNNTRKALRDGENERLKFEVQGAIRDVAKTARPWFDAQLSVAVQQANDGDPAVAYQNLQAKLQAARMDAYKQVGEDADMNWVFKPMEDSIENFRKFTSGEYTREFYEENNKTIMAKEKSALLTSDPEIGRTIVLQETMGSNFSLLFPSLNPKVVSKMAGYMRGVEEVADGQQPADEAELPNIYSDGTNNNSVRKDNNTILGVVKGQMEVQNSGKGTELGKSQAMNTMTNVFKSMGENSGYVKNPRQMKNAIDFLADDEVNKFSVDNGIDTRVVDDVKEVIEKQYQGPLMEAVTERWESQEVANPNVNVQNAGPSTSGVGAGNEGTDPQSGMVKDFVDVIWDGDGVRFVPKPEYADGSVQFKRFVDGLNRGDNSIAAPLNKLIKASATVSGTNDYKSVWEGQLKDRFFPEEDELVNQIEKDLGVEKEAKDSSTNDFNEQEGPAAKAMMESFTDGEGGLDALNKGTSGGKIIGSTMNGKINGKAVSQSTIGEIVTAQANKEAFAVGSMQVIPETMQMAIKAGVVSEDEVFNEETQTKLFNYLVTEKRPEVAAYIEGDNDDLDKALLGMAKEFASWPNPKTGDSYYGQGNKAQFGVEEAKAKLMAFREENTPSESSGGTAIKRQLGLAALDRGGGKAKVAGLTFRHKDQAAQVVPKMKDALVKAKEAAGLDELDIVSGYRSPSHNKKVGSGKGSRHLHGDAVDISMDGMTDSQKTQLVKSLNEAGVKRFITYSGNNSIHVDFGTLGLGSKNAHFMFNKSNKNMGDKRVPEWFKRLEKEIK